MLTLALVACLSAANEALLVTPEDLAKLENVRIVDVRSAEDYAKGHIPGAVNVDVDAFSETRDGVKGLLKPVDQLKPLLEAAGLHPARHAVIYTNMEKVEGVRQATRLFWILEYLGFPQVSVLDGGYEGWIAGNREVQTEAVKPEPTPLPELKPREELRATADEVALASKEPGVELVDVRSPEEYKGDKKNDAVSRAGHISSAENVPASSLVQGGQFKSVDEINKVMEEKGVRPDASAITYCNTGRQASVGYFVLRLTGRENVSLYDGSMSDWTSDPSRPVVTGPEDDPWKLHDLESKKEESSLRRTDTPK